MFYPMVMGFPFRIDVRRLYAEGDVFMIPETSQNGAVELYRAAPFPDRWQYVRDLISGIDAADATLLHERGRWWMFANVREAAHVSSWDELCLFFSDDPVGGAWQAHPMNPIVSDSRRARPAGAFIRRDGRLIRPAQASVQRYGSGLCFAEVVELSETHYAERLVGETHAGGLGRVQGIHSYAETDHGAFVDAYVRRFRWR